MNGEYSKRELTLVLHASATSLYSLKNNRWSVRFHSMLLVSRDGLESKISFFPRLRSLLKKKVVFTSRKVDNVVRALHERCLCRASTLGVAQLLRFGSHVFSSYL